jgi:hypothetical protein
MVRSAIHSFGPCPGREKVTFARLILLLVGLLTLAPRTGLAESPPPTQAPSQSFEQWKAACNRLPSNRSLHGHLPRKELLPLPKFSEFDAVLSAFLNQSKIGPMAQSANWVGEDPARSGFFNTTNAYFLKSTSGVTPLPFQPFAQNFSIPAGSEVFFHADFHGDVHSLLADLGWLNEHGYLRGFQVARPNFYMIFLGDYTDRGSYGIEVLYTLLRLKLANPGQVFLARGNHEELSIQSRYGFLEEGRGKYGGDFNPAKLVRAYDFLPVVIYLGSGENFIQCNHGGMEPGFNPQELLGADGPIRFRLIGKLNQQQFLKQNPQWLAQAEASSRQLATHALRDFKPEDPIQPIPLGFMWNDFSLLASDPQFAEDPGRAFVYGEKATAFLLQKGSTATQKLQAVFRGHQQSPQLNPMMRRLLASRGVFRHWQSGDSAALLTGPIPDVAKHLETADERSIPSGSVWTFNVSPDSVYGEGCNYTFDAFGILKVAVNFADWKLQVVNIPVNP